MKKIIIQTPKGERKIGPGEPCFIIAEMSANHNQDYNKAVEIVKAAAYAGADAVKIQTYTPDMMTLDCDKKWFVVGDVIGSDDNPESWKGVSLYDYKLGFELGGASTVAAGSIFHFTDQNPMMTRNYLSNQKVNVRP